MSNIGPDLLGQRFGRLVVQEKLGKLDKWAWLCRCDCGKNHKTLGSALTSGRVVSCGCFRLEMLGTSNLSHGMCHTPTWKVWAGIIKRCTQSNCAAYPCYGGRGIKVYDRWRDFAAFYEDMGERPHGLTIERKDVNGDYCKDNCEWIPMARQALNTRRTHFVDLNSNRVPLKVACDTLGVRYSRVLDRINRLGWEPERALTEGIHVNQFG